MDQDRRDFLQDSARLGAFALTSAALWRIDPALAQSGSGRELATLSIDDLSHRLANLKITSRQLVEQALAAIKDPQGEGSRTFLRIHESEALAAADQVDARRRGGANLHALAGIPISIKDLFDEAGVTTLGGSKVLVGTPAATRDSTVVERLKKAGAVIIGRTNLVEFAYSLLGLNPHYGTPKNAFDRATGRIPGGSTACCRCPSRSVRPGRSRKPSPTAHCSIRYWQLKPTAFRRLPSCVACVSRCPRRCSKTTCRRRSPTPSRRRSAACRPPARLLSTCQWLNSPKPRSSIRAAR